MGLGRSKCQQNLWTKSWSYFSLVTLGHKTTKTKTKTTKPTITTKTQSNQLTKTLQNQTQTKLKQNQQTVFSQEKWLFTVVLGGVMRVQIHEWDTATRGFLVCTMCQLKTLEPMVMPWNESHASEKVKCHVSFTTCCCPAALQSFLHVHCLFFIHAYFSRFKVLVLSSPYLLVYSPYC